jgi:hypothetical protein
MTDMIFSLDASLEIVEPVVYDNPTITRVVSVNSVGASGNIGQYFYVSRGVVNSLPEVLSPSALDLQTKLRTKWLDILENSKELENIYPDPVQGMIDLLGDIPGDYNTWREIIEEPYG